MRRKEILKRSGGVRTVFCPSAKEKTVLRAELKTLVAHNTTMLPHAHGFMPERSPLTAAKQHVGFAVTINLDLKDFFPSVKPEMVRGLVPKTLNPLCWAGDGCGQGLPTAPAIANLAAKSMDEAVVKYCKKQEKRGVMERFAYTRYADDLTLSLSPDPGKDVISCVKRSLAEIVTRCGFKPNPRKWRVQRCAGGRREIVGLLVGGSDDPIRPTRKWRRMNRAMQHKARRLEGNSRASEELLKLRFRLMGQQQWLVPKQPLTGEEKTARNLARADTTLLAQANKLCEKVNLPALTSVRRVIPVATQTFSNGWIARITNDPVYYVGVSDYVTRAQRSSSCLRTGLVWKTGFGQYGGGGAWWWQLRGCSIAHIVDPTQQVEACGVTRPVQLARVWIFELENGTRWYQVRIYAETETALFKLKQFLRDENIRPVREFNGEQKIVGSVPITVTRKPYLDSGSFHEFINPSDRKRHVTVRISN